MNNNNYSNDNDNDNNNNNKIIKKTTLFNSPQKNLFTKSSPISLS